MTMFRFLLAVALVSCLPACQTTALEPIPARIVEPDADSRAALNEAVSSALSGVDVLLAPDALTDSSTLVLERSHPSSRDVMRTEGRRFDRPERFRLLLQGGACILVHEDSGRHQMLADTRCEPE